MKPTILSTEQKRIKEAYKLAIAPAMLVFMLGWLVVVGPVTWLLNVLGWKENVNLGGTTVIFLLLAHGWTIRKLGRQGLSLSSQRTEVIACEVTQERFGVVSWRHPKTLWGSLGITFSCLLFCGLFWSSWQWPSSRSSSSDRITGVLGFGMFFVLALLQIISIRSPSVRLDDKEIFALNGFRLPRRARWADIASCEIRSVYDYLGNGPSRFFYFKSTTGKTLLRVSPASLSGLSRDEQAEIEREIRHRMGHQPQNPPQR